MFAQVDLLFLGKPVPQTGAVEGQAMLGEPRLIRQPRTIPVDVDFGVVELLYGSLEQSSGRSLQVNGSPTAHARHTVGGYGNLPVGLGPDVTGRHLSLL